MTIHKFPGSGDSSQENGGKTKRKLPEFIDLEEAREECEEEEPVFLTPPPIDLPIHYRVLCLLGSVLAAFWTFGGLMLQAAFLLGYALTLCSSQFMRMLVLDCWERVRKGALVALCFLIAAFSPQLALVVILSYATLQGSAWKGGMLGKALKKRFGDMMP